MFKEKILKAKQLIFFWFQKTSLEVLAEIKAWEIKKITPKKILNICIFLIALGMGIYFQWGIMGTLIFIIFIGIILRPVSSRIMAVPALFFLVLTPIALILKKDLVAENFAIYAYYFLILATIMGIYEVRQEKDEKSAE
jgi:hypothetical protein